MELNFPDYSSCRDCTLWESATHSGLPTRAHTVTGKDKALVIVGEAPGYNEDRQGKSWIGWSVQLLDTFIKAAGFAEYADVYLSNAARCKPPQEKNVGNSEVSKCRKHLIADLQIIAGQYKEIVILACGKPAAKSVGDFGSISEAFHYQGTKAGSLLLPSSLSSPPPEKRETPPSCPVVAFYTYHPAILHPKRKPAYVHAVEAHFVLVARYLRGEFMPNQVEYTMDIGTDPDGLQLPNRVGLDIETYGILMGQEQTVFHPQQSKIVDGADFDKQIVTVAFGFRKDNQIKTYLYVWSDRDHRDRIRKWFNHIVHNKITLTGHHIKFDLNYLSACDKVLNYWIDPNRLTLDDTLVLAFLLYDQQPEKGLKELSTLYGLTSYGELPQLYKDNPAKDSYDPRLHRLNSLDVATHIVLGDELLARIEKKYGPKSPKLSSACGYMRNAVIWDCLSLEQAGCAMSVEKLQAVHNNASTEKDKSGQVLTDADIIPEGTGSDSSTREFITKCLIEFGLMNDPRVVFTKKTRKVSTNKENVNLVIESAPENHPMYPLVQAFKKFGEHSKTIDTYTGPLLTDKRKGIVSCGGGIGVVLPSWYPVPSYPQKEGEGKTGGTIQGRITCKKPPLQTCPTDIYNCICSRFPDGILRGFDLSQIELRVAALLSGDPLLLGAYQEGRDLHTDTAKKLYPDLCRTDKEWKDTKERKLAKTINFLVLYRGGSKALMDTARSDLGLMLEEDFCADLITRWYKEYRIFQWWQNNLIQSVGAKGYLELPTGWSRTFSTNHDAISFLINEICNFPIQTLAAQLFESAQFEILRTLRRMKFRTIIPLQTYDSLLVDSPFVEVEAVDAIVGRWLTRPPILDIIEEKAGRSVPIGYERKVIATYDTATR